MTTHRWVLLAAAVVVVATLWGGRHGWFGVDAWDWIADRRFTVLDDWFHPHGSHWTALQFVLIRGLYLVVGIDWWPWFPLLNAMVLVASLVTIDWALRIRGLSAPTAAGIAGGLTMMWTLLQPEHLARPVGVAAAIAIATLMGASQRRARWAVVGWGMLGVTAGAVAIVAVGVATLVAVVRRDWRQAAWWWPPLVPLAAYGAWRVAWLPGAGSTGGLLSTRTITRLPEYLHEAVAGVVTIGGPIAVAAAVALLGLVVWTLADRRADPTAWQLLAVAGGLAVVAIALRGETHAFGRFGTQFVPLVVVAVAPCLSRTTARSLAVVVVGLGLLRLDGVAPGLDAIRQDRRDHFAATVSLEIAGEPMHGGANRVFSRLYGQLSPQMIGRIVADGYEPSASTQPQLTRARGARRVLGWSAGQPDGTPLRGLEGCTEVARTSVWHVARSGRILLRDAGEVQWRWEDRWGVGVGQTSTAVSSSSRAILHLADGPATLTLTTQRPAELCQ